MFPWAFLSFRPNDVELCSQKVISVQRCLYFPLDKLEVKQDDKVYLLWDSEGTKKLVNGITGTSGLKYLQNTEADTIPENELSITVLSKGFTTNHKIKTLGIHTKGQAETRSGLK